MHRRSFLWGASAASAGALAWRVSAQSALAKVLEMPPLLDTTLTGRLNLTAQRGLTLFAPGAVQTMTAGFNQGYFGPTIRMQNGPLAVEVKNALTEIVNVHWHGMLVPGVYDGPHSLIAPGDRWTPEMEVAQSPATLWYHSHVHGRTAPHVYWGLAGALQITDGRDDQRGLPATYGVDDLMLAIQDRRFDADGRMTYAPTMTDVLNGFHGDRILINGQAGRVAVVPTGIVRLRLLNASNARIYTLSFSDRRPMRLVATDSGFVGRPADMTYLRLAPGERAEVLVDFSDGQPVVLQNTRGVTMVVLRFAPDSRLPVRITSQPETLDEDPVLPASGPVRTRRIGLNMGGDSTGFAQNAPRGDQSADSGQGTHSGHGTPSGHGVHDANGAYGGQGANGGHGAYGGHGAEDAHAEMTGAGVSDFGINGRPYDMSRIDWSTKIGTRERWTIGGGGTAPHPFHVHGCRFRVLSEGGGAGPSPQNRGWKDVVLVTGETEIEMDFLHGADPNHPYMLHCHILEHEDAGMMAQFTVL